GAERKKSQRGGFGNTGLNRFKSRDVRRSKFFGMQGDHLRLQFLVSEGGGGAFAEVGVDGGGIVAGDLVVGVGVTHQPVDDVTGGAEVGVDEAVVIAGDLAVEVGVAFVRVFAEDLLIAGECDAVEGGEVVPGVVDNGEFSVAGGEGGGAGDAEGLAGSD